MQLSRQILVLTPDQPFQYCYNATLPFLYSICDPSKSLYCSKKRPEFGCTKIREDACINFHFCNTPPVVYCFLALALLLILLLVVSGCCWCCCCCFCGWCCQRTCPCFARMKKSPERKPSSIRVTPLNTLSWNMYEGLDHIQKITPRNPEYPSAPKNFDIYD
ncbi:hypothetical protein TCAL_06606 [Tigriopus californicus]|uniref:Uncharacterized protein n=1 Tax=Tigriopus californicus TaxID=6832 RepID=A0A553PPY4_TIGCA|nr:uncharacterized protein LOC131882720 [Tigriopus californicus]XP_059085943.1 uncharacterized protein LOC131882720 [Tigriopus californicus]TRY79752.1 hypothetical protein TCAL_06606 [Tigriopus californicus]